MTVKRGSARGRMPEIRRQISEVRHQPRGPISELWHPISDFPISGLCACNWQGPA